MEISHRINRGERMEKERLNINVCDGMIRIGSLSPGLWLNVLQDGGVMIGAMTRWTLVVGLGTSSK